MMTRPIDITVWLLTLLGTCYSEYMNAVCNGTETCTTPGQSCTWQFSNCVLGRCEWTMKYNAEACIHSNQCQGRTRCTSGICSCAYGTYNTVLKKCTTLKEVGQTCAVNRDCHQGGSEAECRSNVCACKSGYINMIKGPPACRNQCRRPVPSEACSSANGAPSCISQRDDEFGIVSANCSSGYCTCPTGSTAKTFHHPDYLYSGMFQTCFTDVAMLADGAVCTTHNQCSSGSCIACPGSTSTTCVTVAGVAGAWDQSTCTTQQPASTLPSIRFHHHR